MAILIIIRRFNSESFKSIGNDLFKLDGELTIRGKTKTETFDMRYKATVEMF